MKFVMATLCMLYALFVTQAAYAANQTLTLSVPGMNCSVCPITVKKALLKVQGVKRVEASLQHKQAEVDFDDALTNVQALLEAAEDAGYPATLNK